MTPATIIREAQADGVRLALSPSGTIKATGDGAVVNRWLAVIREHKAEIIDELKVGAGDTAAASRWWRVHFPDRDPVEVSCCPEAIHAEILELYPDAVAAEPFTPELSDALKLCITLYPDAVAAEPFTPTSRQPSAPLTANEEAAIRAWLALTDETDPATVAEVIGQCQRDADARSYFLAMAAELPKPDPFRDDRRTCDQCANLTPAGRCLAAWRGEIVASRTYEPIPDLPRRCEGYAPGADDPDRRHGGERWPWLMQG